MPIFDMIAVGCGGGPSEDNLSCYLFKPHDARWNDGIIALEGGSAIGAFQRLLHSQPGIFGTEENSNTAAKVYSWITCFLITHAHLDHINGLVLTAGSSYGGSKSVYGSSHTLEDIEAIFSGRIWPRLASRNNDGSPLVLRPLTPNDEYQEIFRGVSVRVMPINHGQNDTSGTYDASAFFVRHDPTMREFLFFGDVEPDEIAQKPRNIEIWYVAAPKIVKRILSTIFIECSWPLGRASETLYGHLSPEHLEAELAALAAEVVAVQKRTRKADSEETAPSTGARKRQRGPQDTPSLDGALKGVRVYIIHCKDDLNGSYPGRAINHVIAEQVRARVDPRKLGVEIIAVDQGMQISI
ncbi:cyclic-AMP phosphodiesterase [Sparassis latifolia]|uniref:3',5'-cyclic-nucleotide phosphodiesterase n=1 Tax=Sparassis crispa TaxID=139825 RepID=A0A401GK19_9APHY|nr:3',5'-cyclic-nucleotide phosphodiesterase [Sparassis crispa]GBE82517.1 3',5'-cyclic-nucleotide phosphodiesterase [Sparassis crispa]